MKLTDEHLELQRTVRQVVENEIDPHVDAWEAAEIFPAHALFKKLGDLGLLGISKPTEYGGMGLDYSFSIVFAEELGRCACGGVPMAIGVQTDMATPGLARYGSKELCEEYLAPTIAGDLVASVGVSEPGAGSDVAALTTTARRVGDEYVIDGTKMWTTSGMQADWIGVLANTGDGPPHRNKSLIVVPLDARGVERTAKLKKLGMWSSDTAQIFFDGVRVPARNLVGEEGSGFTIQMQQFQEERMFLAASVLRMLEGLIAKTIDYARDRKAFGRSVLDNQVVHYRLAELSTEIEALRALIYGTCERYLEDRDDHDVVKLASMCKLKSARLAREVSDACLQYWGGMGYMWESPIARGFRDARAFSLAGGADEVMLQIVAKAMGTLPKR